MAKKGMVEREKKRARLVEKYAEKRAELKEPILFTVGGGAKVHLCNGKRRAEAKGNEWEGLRNPHCFFQSLFLNFNSYCEGYFVSFLFALFS